MALPILASNTRVVRSTYYLNGTLCSLSLLGVLVSGCEGACEAQPNPLILNYITVAPSYVPF